MEGFSTNIAPPRSVKGAKKRSQSDLRPKMRVSRRKETQVHLHQETPKKHPEEDVSLIQEEEYTKVTFCTSSYMKKKVLIHKNENYTVSVYTCRRYSLSPVPLSATRKNHDLESESYDPLTNYRSPGPNFLMYNPDKERDRDVEKMGLLDSHEDGSVERLDEKKQGMFCKVMKFLFVLCAIVFPTLFVWSMYLPKTGHLLSFKDSANEFALGSVFLNETLGKELSFREASRSVIVEKSVIGYDRFHVSNEGEVVTEISDLLQIFVNDNAVEQVLEDFSKLCDPPDLDENREIGTETLRLPYVTDIQGVPHSMQSTDEVLSDEKVTSYEGACEGTGEEKMVAEHQVETVVNLIGAIGERNHLPNAEFVNKIHFHGESAKMGGFSYKIDEKRIVLRDILSTCEVVDSARELGDDQTMSTEAMVTDVVLVMGSIALLLGGIALLAKALRLVWRVFTKPSDRVPSSVIQECVESVIAEDSRDVLLAKEGESTEEKKQFAVEQRLIELCHFQAPRVDLLGEYVTSPEFCRSSLEECTRRSSPVEAQQTKREVFHDSPSVSASCSKTPLNSNRRIDQDKIVRKEEKCTTALRRSARIRNKTVSSRL